MILPRFRGHPEKAEYAGRSPHGQKSKTHIHEGIQPWPRWNAGNKHPTWPNQIADHTGKKVLVVFNMFQHVEHRKRDLRAIILKNPELLRDLLRQYKAKPVGSSAGSVSGQ